MRNVTTGIGPIRLRSKRRKKICEILIRMYGNECFFCTRSFDGDDAKLRSLDHLLPISRGGTHELDNLVLCCTKCNNAKADLTWWEYIHTDEYETRLAWVKRQIECPPKKVKVEIVTDLAVA